jgi:hypothetical protein
VTFRPFHKRAKLGSLNTHDTRSREAGGYIWKEWGNGNSYLSSLRRLIVVRLFAYWTTSGYSQIMKLEICKDLGVSSLRGTHWRRTVTAMMTGILTRVFELGNLQLVLIKTPFFEHYTLLPSSIRLILKRAYWTPSALAVYSHYN